MNMMSKKQIVLYVVIITLALGHGLKIIKQNSKVDQLTTRIESMQGQLEEQLRVISEMNTEIKTLKLNQLEVAVEDPTWFWDIYGYPSSPEEVLQSLSNEDRLIPFKGVLGGTTRFVVAEARIIDPYYVYVPIDDGHMMGGMILKYEFTNDNSIIWSVIDGWWPDDLEN